MKAARLAVEFRGKINKTTFLKDLKTQSAILHQLLVLGEVVKRLSEKFWADHPEIPWTMVAGMRDKLIHEYDAVDLNEVWKTVNADVPSLISVLKPLMPSKKIR